MEVEPGASTYTEWMGIAEEVKSRFEPLLRARAFHELVRRAREQFDLEDPFVLEFVFAGMATIPMPGDPVWGFLVGPPSALKTEILRWLNRLPQVVSLSHLTSHSLISGLKGGSSLLPDLDGKVLVIKDFTTILEMDRKSREEVFSQLRDAFDGYYEGWYGSVGKLSFRSHFHVLAAVTSAIEDYYSVQSFLGPRFLKVRVPKIDGFDRSVEQGGREGEIRDEFEERALAVLSKLKATDWSRVSFDRVQELRPLVQLLAKARTHVSRFNGAISLLPEPEMLPRLAKQLKKLAIGRALIYGRLEVEVSDLEFIRRVVLDTIPQNRALVLEALRVPATAQQLRGEVRLPESTLYRCLEDLEALDLVYAEGGKPQTFHLTTVALAGLTPHFSERTIPGPSPKEVGGDPASEPWRPVARPEVGGERP
ncbi:MAG: hypothetical protein L3K07_09240 [Thermoplasmata archaeon]|nr:hypothetical protein [Thermoplasmata archaeon]